MTTPLLPRLTVLGLCLSALVPVACGDDDDSGGGGGGATADSGTRGVEQVGQACTAPTDCFADLAEGGTVRGEPVCLDRVEDGYCTHECAADTDCCAVPGECRTDLPQVCSPFESDGRKLCFLSCEDSDIREFEKELFADGGAIDSTVFCEQR
ncbi:MAG: hypothetical protein FJ104_06635, partial [Deltaproteobacteria bacterium]|nr:hypothetical protein [Deltaproteobacteria bacterium]